MQTTRIARGLLFAVVEAPLDEKRNLAVIEEVVKLVPNKPIRFLVNTHQHHDHIGGLRTYMHIGATIITHWKNYDFYVHDVLNYAPRTLQPDMVALWPPTELAEGYQYEVVRENYTLTDGARTMLISYVQPLQHAEGMLMAYLPAEKMRSRRTSTIRRRRQPRRRAASSITSSGWDSTCRPSRRFTVARCRGVRS
jgi:metallo-beta-lactamase superfamily protein